MALLLRHYRQLIWLELAAEWGSDSVQGQSVELYLLPSTRTSSDQLAVAADLQAADLLDIEFAGSEELYKAAELAR